MLSRSFPSRLIDCCIGAILWLAVTSAAAQVTMTASRGEGTTFDISIEHPRSLPDQDIKVRVTNGQVTVVQRGPGTLVTRVVPSITSGEIEVRVQTPTVVTARTYIVLPKVERHWDQPEAVPGDVNTLGWEDSVEVSPDGEWLLIGSYTPVSLFCCLGGKAFNGAVSEQVCAGATADGDGSSPACETSRGPYSAPLRPGLGGAERILSGTHIIDRAPLLGVDDSKHALPPVSGFGFHRQADGSFREPFVIKFENDGYTWSGGGFGHTFLGAPSGANARLVLAFSAPDSQTGNDLFLTSVRLGQPIILGRYAFELPGKIVRHDFRIEPLKLHDLKGHQGNPNLGAGYLWFDNEGEWREDLWAAKNSSGDPLGPYEPAERVAVSTFWKKDTQPYFHGGRLYWSEDFQSIRSAAFSGSAPAEESSWSDARVEVGLDGTGVKRVGGIVSLGETSIATDRNRDNWLYFVYTMRRDWGLETNVGRVKKRL